MLEWLGSHTFVVRSEPYHLMRYSCSREESKNRVAGAEVHRISSQENQPQEVFVNKRDILTLYHYNAWSNTRILDAASRLTQEQFLASASFPHGGLQGTLTHAFFAEWLWRQRWEGTAPPFAFTWGRRNFPRSTLCRRAGPRRRAFSCNSW